MARVVKWNKEEVSMKIKTISTDSLGNRGYLIHDGVIAIMVDVQRD